MSETLAPAPGPLVAELLVDGLVALDVEALTAAFTARGLADGGPFLPNGKDFIRRAQNGGVRIEMRDEPVPGGDLAKPLADALKWWDAGVVSSHRATIAVAAASRTVPGPTLAQFHVQATAAVLDAATERGATVLGVLWNGERLYPADFVRQHATTDPALGLIVGFHVPEPNAHTSVYTSGLSMLGLRNIEADPTDDVSEAARMVQNMALYLLQHGDVIHDGHTVGYSPTHHIAVREAEASWGGERVLRLALARS